MFTMNYLFGLQISEPFKQKFLNKYLEGSSQGELMVMRSLKEFSVWWKSDGIYQFFKF